MSRLHFEHLSRTRILLSAIILAGLLGRLHGLTHPMAGFRPSDTAANARNFYENGMQILYPQIDWRGASAGFVESEFPVYTYTVALLYKIVVTDGVHPN